LRFVIVALSERVHTFGQYLLGRYGERVHKLAIHAGFTCPNRDGNKGRGGCTFCNNVSFNPGGRKPISVAEQIEAGRQVVRKRTGAQRYLAYFQAYTNTYGDFCRLKSLYDEALNEPDIIGLAIGTRPDCVAPEVLDLLASYRARGHEIWLELGLQSAFDESLRRVNRGHGFAEYRATMIAARARGIPVCTHLILGLPGEDRAQMLMSLERVLELGTEGLKLHPLHVVRGTQLANEWRVGDYRPLVMRDYIELVAEMVERTPPEVIYHRLTGTASAKLLLAPAWCEKKWVVLNGIESALLRRRGFQGSSVKMNVEANGN
jgi:radical SAM protein (TIGR01212 family)